MGEKERNVYTIRCGLVREIVKRERERERERNFPKKNVAKSPVSPHKGLRVVVLVPKQQKLKMTSY